MLMQESGCKLEHQSAMKFRESVLSGEWDRVCFFVAKIFLCYVFVLNFLFPLLN